MKVNTTLILTKELIDSLERYSKKHNISKKETVTQSLENFIVKKQPFKVVQKKSTERVCMLFNSDKEFLERLKIIAVKQNVSLSELVRQILNSSLN